MRRLAKKHITPNLSVRISAGCWLGMACGWAPATSHLTPKWRRRGWDVARVRVGSPIAQKRDDSKQMRTVQLGNQSSGILHRRHLSPGGAVRSRRRTAVPIGIDGKGTAQPRRRHSIQWRQCKCAQKIPRAVQPHRASPRGGLVSGPQNGQMSGRPMDILHRGLQLPKNNRVLAGRAAQTKVSKGRVRRLRGRILTISDGGNCVVAR